MTLWTNKQTENTLRTVFKLDIPNGNGNIYHNGIQVGYADSFNGIRLSKKAIDPDSLTDFTVWNPYEATNFEIDCNYNKALYDIMKQDDNFKKRFKK